MDVGEARNQVHSVLVLTDGLADKHPRPQLGAGVGAPVGLVLVAVGLQRVELRDGRDDALQHVGHRRRNGRVIAPHVHARLLQRHLVQQPHRLKTATTSRR